MTLSDQPPNLTVYRQKRRLLPSRLTNYVQDHTMIRDTIAIGFSSASKIYGHGNPIDYTYFDHAYFLVIKISSLMAGSQPLKA